MKNTTIKWIIVMTIGAAGALALLTVLNGFGLKLSSTVKTVAAVLTGLAFKDLSLWFLNRKIEKSPAQLKANHYQEAEGD